VAVGRKAFHLAESALNEALLDFLASMNVPSDDPDSWFRRLRLPLCPGCDGCEEVAFTPSSVRMAHDEDDVEVDCVTVFSAKRPRGTYPVVATVD
jgi:hypothetical protein